MKQLFLFIAMLCIAICNAQIVPIPNAAFKAKLLAANSTNFYASTEEPTYSTFYNNWNSSTSNAIDTNGNGEIEVSEALAIKSLNLKNLGLTDLTGIAFFTNLMSLHVNGNSLTALNLNQNTALINLRCENNVLTTLNISELVNLKDFNCEFNQLTFLDIPQSATLQRLYCNNNNLTSLNVSQLPALEILQCNFNTITALDVSSCIS